MMTDPTKSDFPQAWAALTGPINGVMNTQGRVPQSGAPTHHLLQAGSRARPRADLDLQPRHALCGGALRAAEASLRNVAPPIAAGATQDALSAARISCWLLEAACDEAQLWNTAETCHFPRHGAALLCPTEIMVSVDMPARSLREGRLLSQAHAALQRSGLSPHLLEIELPEFAVADGSTEVLLGMSALRDLGIGLALDHFGSVSASLRLLQRLPITAVKLDPSLIRDVVHNRETRATVAAAIGLAHALNTTVVATGVQSAAQRDILADMGCDDAQGSMFGGSMAAAQFRAALSSLDATE